MPIGGAFPCSCRSDRASGSDQASDCSGNPAYEAGVNKWQFSGSPHFLWTSTPGLSPRPPMPHRRHPLQPSR